MLCLSEWTPTPTIVMCFFSAVVEYMLVEIESCHWREVAPFALIWMAFVKNVFWCAFLEWLPVDMHNRIVCTCVASPHCEWACVVPGAQPHQMNLHILHICELPPQCGWPCAPSSGVLDWMTSHILSKCGLSLHCGWACVFSGFQFYQMISGIGHMCMSFHCCGLPCASSDVQLDQMTCGIGHSCIYSGAKTLDQPPLPRSSRPSEEKGGPLDNH